MPMGDSDRTPSSWSRRVAWLVAIWSVSVLVLAAFAYLLRMVMNAVGMTV